MNILLQAINNTCYLQWQIMRRKERLPDANIVTSDARQYGDDAPGNDEGDAVAAGYFDDGDVAAEAALLMTGQQRSSEQDSKQNEHATMGHGTPNKRLE